MKNKLLLVAVLGLFSCATVRGCESSEGSVSSITLDSTENELQIVCTLLTNESAIFESDLITSRTKSEIAKRYLKSLSQANYEIIQGANSISSLKFLPCNNTKSNG